MTALASEAADVSPAPALLDPFVYFDGVASKIRGLGGTVPRPELDYGFHTLYVRCAPGRCAMTVRLAGLAATSGTLILQLNILSVVPGSHPRIATIERLAFAEIVAAGGEATIRFESLRGQIYALYGKIEGDTDAVASALAVELDRLGKEEDELDPARKIAPVRFGATSVLAVERLASAEDATFTDPVSQSYTSSQSRETAYRKRAEELGETAAPSASQWTRIYPLQVLHRYGMLQEGARGLNIGPVDAPFGDVLARQGCALEHRRVADLLAAGQEGAPTDVPGDHFDFLWTGLLAEQFDTAAALLSFAEALMARLRPRGLAVLMVRFMREASAPAAWSAGAALNRGDIERLALNLVSRNHEIAQLKLSGGRAPAKHRRAPEPTSCGIIARRR